MHKRHISIIPLIGQPAGVSGATATPKDAACMHVGPTVGQNKSKTQPLTTCFCRPPCAPGRVGCLSESTVVERYDGLDELGALQTLVAVHARHLQRNEGPRGRSQMKALSPGEISLERVIASFDRDKSACHSHPLSLSNYKARAGVSNACPHRRAYSKRAVSACRAKRVDRGCGICGVFRPGVNQICCSATNLEGTMARALCLVTIEGYLRSKCRKISA
jgi:hypothetical protein